jgi:hypothetical protein
MQTSEALVAMDRECYNKNQDQGRYSLLEQR